MDAIELIKYFLGGLSILVIGYLLYQYKTTQSRIKNLENDLSEQKVINQSFSDYNKFRDEKDSESKKLVLTILRKIDELKASFDTRFDDLKSDFHNLELQFAGGKK